LEEPLLCRRRTEKGRKVVVGSGCWCVIVGRAVCAALWGRCVGWPQAQSREQIQLQEVPGYLRHGPVEVQAPQKFPTYQRASQGAFVVEGWWRRSWTERWIGEDRGSQARGWEKYRSETRCNSPSRFHYLPLSLSPLPLSLPLFALSRSSRRVSLWFWKGQGRVYL